MRGMDTLNEEMLRLYIYAYSADDVCYPSKRPLTVASRPPLQPITPILWQNAAIALKSQVMVIQTSSCASSAAKIH